MSAHTPGPWSVSELEARGEISEYYIFIEPHVAVVERKRAGHDQNDMSDASLIAAAPEMLEALIKIVKYADSEPDDGVTVEMHRANIERARAAIAKAEGAT